MTSSGWSKWEYIEVPDWATSDKEELRDFFESQEDVATWSEHYRRVEWKRVKKLPRDILEGKIEKAKREIEYWQEILDELYKMEPAKRNPNVTENNKRIKKMNKIYRQKGLYHLVREFEKHP